MHVTVHCSACSMQSGLAAHLLEPSCSYNTSQNVHLCGAALRVVEHTEKLQSLAVIREYVHPGFLRFGLHCVVI